ncbi:MAG TPA: tRNA (guanosine(46)-N7)-methyltransferase TrmB [Candidatus Copromorpha excrementigallinarum]|uniref:tRNA (guanine-N(7)-)-methyltransferase n=1 Tax=Candidatus Allocopromorpha excrementigallinarum TaxID=2840742 RepID=A0A9D1I2K0_9FIRM|nr:tRNA (guanosine(46)-N7)-methyltransferase TrmB [Candidatus Copromorpha excrementigallinarum]
MRQRKAKDLEERLMACSSFIVREPSPCKWREIFGSRKLYVEIGCGKGSFIIKKALKEPEAGFVGVEGQETVILRALEKARAEKKRQEEGGCLRSLENLRFLPVFMDGMENFFEEESLEGIFLNFSDPWPKTRHEKRRLTHRNRLRDYMRVLKRGGAIEVKTDNNALFDFTLREGEAAGLEAVRLTRDLHASGLPAAAITTEYEEKFMNKGKNINYVKFIRP